MTTGALRRSDFKETYAVHAALRYSLKKKLFASDASARRSAEKLLRYLEGDRSMYGRQCKMLRLMARGATIAQLRKGLNCSRRTIFRYLVDLEKADIDITLEGGVYTVDRALLRLVS